MGKDQSLNMFIKRIRKRYAGASLYLFGSRARGDFLKHSDYDVIIVSDKFEGTNFIRRMIDMQRYWDGRELLEALCYTRQEFEKLRNGINTVSHAMKYAKKLL